MQKEAFWRGIIPAWAALCTAIVIVMGWQTALAAPWPRPPGRGFVESRTDYFASTDAFGRFERFDGALYAEYGLLRALTIGGKAVYGTSRQTAPGFRRSASGIAEIEGFAQYAVYQGDWDVLSVRAAGARPASLAAGARPALAADGADIEVRALYGRTLRSAPHKIFVTAETGYRKRLGAAADQTRIDAGIGYEPSRNWLFLLEAQTTLSLRNNDEGGADFDVLKFQPSIVWRFSRRYAVRAGGVFETATRNLTPGAGGFLAIWMEF